MKFTKVILLTGLLGLMSTTVMAAEAPDFSDMDKNENASIDEAEFDKAKNDGVEKTFAEIDENKDGKISEKEYEAVKEPDCE